jgi:uncharacterized protein (DUF433 family)
MRGRRISLAPPTPLPSVSITTSSRPLAAPKPFRRPAPRAIKWWPPFCNPQIFDVCAIIETMMSVHPRITIESDKRDGKPCIRGMRITVNDVLGWLAHGMTEEEILEEHPGLEKEDFAAVYAFAADVADATPVM